MYPLLHSSSSSSIFITIVIISLGFSTPFKILKDESKFEACKLPFTCGNKSFAYPFWGGERIQDCGHPDFKLNCHNHTYPEIEIVSKSFYVLDMREWDETITVVGADMVDDGCPDRVTSLTIEAIEQSPFECASNNAKLTYLYNCSNGIIPNTTSFLRCTSNVERVYDGYYLKNPSDHQNQSCKSLINIPLLQKYYTDLVTNKLNTKDALRKGFDFKYKFDYGQKACWDCLKSYGQCGFSKTSHEFVCFSVSVKAASDPHYESCIVPKICGNQTISFPFFIQGQQEPYCGYPGFNLTCDSRGRSIINLSSQNYVVLQIFYQNQSVIVSNAAFLDLDDEQACFPFIRNLTDLSPDFKIAETDDDRNSVVLLYNCRFSSIERNNDFLKNRIGCYGENQTNSVLAFYESEEDELVEASRMCVPGPNGDVMAAKTAVVENNELGMVTMRDVVRSGFMVNWIASNCSVCEESGGRCGFLWDIYHFRCFCPDRPHALKCFPVTAAPAAG
ncbi:hypothetical protein F8388_015096 [Cannabis sativa]|nr:hypothetical protein F8388_015096 [Cannabis sativa]